MKVYLTGSNCYAGVRHLPHVWHWSSLWFVCHGIWRGPTLRQILAEQGDA